MSDITSFKGAAEALRVPASLVRRMARQGLVPVIRVPNAKPRIDVGELRRALERFTTPVTQEP